MCIGQENPLYVSMLEEKGSLMSTSKLKEIRTDYQQNIYLLKRETLLVNCVVLFFIAAIFEKG